MVYLVFLAAYLMITYIIYNRRYTKGRKQVKEYYNRLKRVSSLYREEENISNTDDWEVQDDGFTRTEGAVNPLFWKK